MRTAGRKEKRKKKGNEKETKMESEEEKRRKRGVGSKQWKKDIGYHRRSLAETAMYRMKCCFGDKLKNRDLPNQRAETRIRSKILNRFTQLGMPRFEWS